MQGREDAVADPIGRGLTLIRPVHLGSIPRAGRYPRRVFGRDTKQLDPGRTAGFEVVVDTADHIEYSYSKGCAVAVLEQSLMVAADTA